MSESTLEEMITATVNARMEAMLQQAKDGEGYRNVDGFIEQRLKEITLEEFTKREQEIRDVIAERVRNMDFSKMELTCFPKINGRDA